MRTFNATIRISHDLTIEGINLDSEEELRDLIADTVERNFRDYETALRAALYEDAEDVWEHECSHDVTSITLISEDDEDAES
jgi:hypothetical protein